MEVAESGSPGGRRKCSLAPSFSLAPRPVVLRMLSIYLGLMPFPSEIDLTVYPDECDAFGHLNQASFLSLFERARWEMLVRGPGMDVFTRAGAWPAVRKTVIDYHAAAFPAMCCDSTRRSPTTAAPASPCGRRPAGSKTTS